MMDLTLSVLALVTGGIALEIYSAARIHLSRQEEHSFQLGFEAYHHAQGCSMQKLD